MSQRDASAVLFAGDIWAYGLILWSLYHNKEPLSEYKNRPHELIIAATRGQPIIPEITFDIPTPAAKLMSDCLRINPADRPSIDTVISALADIFSEELL